LSRLTLNHLDVRPTFHYLMIKKIMEKLPNARENHYAEEPQYVDGFRPDIIVQNSNKLEVHKVEVINDTDYDPIWDKHLLEELRKEIARFSDKNTVADCLGGLKNVW